MRPIVWSARHVCAPCRSTSTTSATRSSSAAASSTACSSTPARSPRSTRCSRRSTRPPQRILLTHIHFDHAGATGALVRRWPDLEVYVHERGAPHLVDPSRLVASADAAVRRRHEAAVGRGRAGARGQPARAARRRDDRRRGASSTRPATPRTTSPTCTSRPARPSSATSAACASTGGPDHPADAAARHRHRAVARVAATPSRPGSPRAWPSPTSAPTTTSATTSPRCTRALDRWAALARETDQRVLRGGDGRRDGAGARRDRDAGLPAGDAARHVVARLDRYWSKKNG